MAITYNTQLKKYNGTDYDIINPKTTASLIGVVGSEQGGYSTSRQFVTGAMLNKLGLTVNSANSFLTLDALGKIDINLIPTDAFLTELEAVPYIGSDNPADGDLIAYKLVSGKGELSYMKQSSLIATNAPIKLALDAKYTLPAGGIPPTDLNEDIITVLGKADSALQPADVINSLTSTDTARPLSAAQGKILQETIAGKTFATSFATISAMVSYLNTATATEFLAGHMFNIVDLDVPDFWVTQVMASSVSYTYTNDNALINAILDPMIGPVQIGYYKISVSETAKVDLTGYVPITRTVNSKALNANIVLDASDVGARANTWVPAYSDITGTKPPSGAQVNSIEAVQVNGTDLTITSKKVNVTRTLVGANKTFIGSTTPVGAIEGDLWFDTSA